jgi:hypothetical protein
VLLARSALLGWLVLLAQPVPQGLLGRPGRG